MEQSKAPKPDQVERVKSADLCLALVKGCKDVGSIPLREKSILV